jgi:hypothetical protein
MGAVRNTLRPRHGTPARQCWRTRQSDHLMGRETVALDCWEHSEPSPLRPLRANHGRARLTRFCRPRRPRRQGSHERATMAACRAPQKRRLTCNSSAGSTKTPWRRLILICRRIGPAYSPGVSGIRKSATTRRASVTQLISRACRDAWCGPRRSGGTSRVRPRPRPCATRPRANLRHPTPRWRCAAARKTRWGVRWHRRVRRVFSDRHEVRVVGGI